ncbi:hypothetical protein SeMB42_g03150 [Synchytrium endobioticum]|uniref:TLC domain-containing protein n=1 Tax=Synchytrium endobioticum TaxID=286115 RepID=A0A507D5Q5_9FUNG|nr:hypothetical protein SeLEV6574_g03197 [Synchytrium endobioticum]TPX47997.1 hypothetical protein SeMB42_g03150 [Synchytrium endobioticum]
MVATYQAWPMIVHILAVVGACFAFKSVFAPLVYWKATKQHHAPTNGHCYHEKLQYIIGFLCYLSWVVFVNLSPKHMGGMDAAYLVAVVFYGNYIFDLTTYLIHWWELKPSFRSYYILHHSICVVVLTIWRAAAGDKSLELAYSVGFIIWISELPLVYLIQLIRFSYPAIWCTPVQIFMVILAECCSIASYFYVGFNIPKEDVLTFPVVMIFMIGLVMDCVDMGGSLYWLAMKMKNRKSKRSALSGTGGLCVDTSKSDGQHGAFTPVSPAKIKSP